MIKKILITFIILASNAFADKKFEEGIDFEIMDSRPSAYQLKEVNKINVAEVFWYGCPHCYVFEEYLSKWEKKNEKDVNFFNIPAVFNKTWLLHAKTFYTIMALKNSSELHKNFFYAYHEQARTFSNKESIINFFNSQGVDPNKAKLIFESEQVAKKVQEANYKLETYKLGGVPVMIINDKYKISGNMAKSYDRMIEISEYIIDLERANRAQ